LRSKELPSVPIVARQPAPRGRRRAEPHDPGAVLKDDVHLGRAQAIGGGDVAPPLIVPQRYPILAPHPQPAVAIQAKRQSRPRQQAVGGGVALPNVLLQHRHAVAMGDPQTPFGIHQQVSHAAHRRRARWQGLQTRRAAVDGVEAVSASCPDGLAAQRQRRDLVGRAKHGISLGQAA